MAMTVVKPRVCAIWQVENRDAHLSVQQNHLRLWWKHHLPDLTPSVLGWELRTSIDYRFQEDADVFFPQTTHGEAPA